MEDLMALVGKERQSGLVGSGIVKIPWGRESLEGASLG
jgi:hypothetical protein